MLTFKAGNIAYELRQYYLSSALPKAYMAEFFSHNVETSISLDDLIRQVLFECAKLSYDNTAPKRSLRQLMKHIDGITDLDEDKRKRIERTFEKIKKYRKGYYDLLNNNGVNLPGLIVPDTTSMAQKKQGYALTEFQYWELKNVHDLKLATAIVDKRFSNKNLTIDAFIDYADQYDSTCQDLKLSHVLPFGELAFFNLAWLYYFDFIYELAIEMEKHDLKELNPKQKHIVSLLIGGPVTPDSILYTISGNRLPQSITMDSRLIHYRRKLIPAIVSSDNLALDGLQKYINEAFMLMAIGRIHRKTTTSPMFQDRIASNTNEEDWQSIIVDYDPFEAFVGNKEWNVTRVRLVRYLYNTLTSKAPR